MRVPVLAGPDQRVPTAIPVGGGGTPGSRALIRFLNCQSCSTVRCIDGRGRRAASVTNDIQAICELLEWYAVLSTTNLISRNSVDAFGHTPPAIVQ
jgi:hypothetical protein